MATLVGTALNIITSTGGAGAPATIQVMFGPVGNQSLLAQINITGPQNTALVSALTAGASTTTLLQYSAQESPLPGVYQAF